MDGCGWMDGQTDGLMDGQSCVSATKKTNIVKAMTMMRMMMMMIMMMR